MTEVIAPTAAPATTTNGTEPAIASETTKPTAESTSEAGEANGNGTMTTSPNGEAAAAAAKTNSSTKPKKEPEPPKDPKEDTIGWLKQQHNAAVHKINFRVLDWLQKAAIEDETKRPALPLKNSKEEAVTRGQFQAYLEDGQLLAHIANKLAPGSIETVHEGEAAKEKANQTSNIQGFINFLKEKASFSDDQVFTVEDLQERGKSGYDAVINTLFQLAVRTPDKFGQSGIELEQIVDEASKLVDPNILKKFVQAVQTRLSAIFNNAKFTRSQSQEAQPQENGAPTENGHVPATENGTATAAAENGTSKPTEQTTAIPKNGAAAPVVIASQ